MNQPAQLWADPRLVYTVAAAAVALLLITLWLFGRRQRQGRQAAVICLMVSIILHAALIFLVPLLPQTGGGAKAADETVADSGANTVEFSSFDPDLESDEAAGDEQEAVVAPLPVAELNELLEEPVTPVESEAVADAEESETVEAETVQEDLPEIFQSVAELGMPEVDSVDEELSNMLSEAFAPEAPVASGTPALAVSTPSKKTASQQPQTSNTAKAQPHPTASAPKQHVPGALENDFANRVGKAKELALMQTGGSVETEAAVQAALRFLVQAQRADGAWDPLASGAGREGRKILGVARPGTGSRAESAITGLALLTLMGAGQTHLEGEYADNVFRGLAYLIRIQQPNGSLAGKAQPYAATYSHGMAALAMCECAAITKDPSAIESARRAISYTTSQQHPTTGGWRYTAGDPGDLSQLGWQAMVLDAGHRARIPIDGRAVSGIGRFLRTVRKGRSGGLASYRPEERPSRTMTAEALATRLLIGETVTQAEIDEAQRFILQQPPGSGQDNYYYWYYATLALHQLQDDGWKRWNEALQQRLLATQRSDGSWSTDTVWGRYGGTVYTTSMATLCLESYYRHAIRDNDSRIAAQPEAAGTDGIYRR